MSTKKRNKEHQRKTSRAYYYANHEKAKEANRRSRAWERFELRRYRNLKTIVQNMDADNGSLVAIKSYMNNDEDKFRQYYSERQQSK